MLGFLGNNERNGETMNNRGSNNGMKSLGVQLDEK